MVQQAEVRVQVIDIAKYNNEGQESSRREHKNNVRSTFNITGTDTN